MKHTVVKTDRIILLWEGCPCHQKPDRHGVEQRLEDIVESGTAICDECGDGLELSNITRINSE